MIHASQMPTLPGFAENNCRILIRIEFSTERERVRETEGESIDIDTRLAMVLEFT